MVGRGAAIEQPFIAQQAAALLRGDYRPLPGNETLPGACPGFYSIRADRRKPGDLPRASNRRRD
jgi:hypothetical protein